MAEPAQRREEELLAENKVLTALNQQVGLEAERIFAYAFSSKIRAVIFQPSAQLPKRPPADKGKVLAKILAKVIALEILSAELKQKTDKFRQKLVPEDFLLQRRYYREAEANLYRALHQIKKIRKRLGKIKRRFIALQANPGPGQMRRGARKIRRNFSALLRILNENANYLGDFQGRYRIESYLRQSYEDILQANILSGGEGWRKLKSGDIWLSFKTISYLKKWKISQGIALFTGSQITHAALFYYDRNKEPTLIHSFGGGYYRADAPKVAEGAVYIVLRPRMPADQRIRLWKAVREKIKMKTRFSKLKTVGVIPTLLISKTVGLFTRRSVLIGNIADTTSTRMFCSEFLNEVFKEAGFYLTPKSRYSSMVFPSDIIASPNVDYIGLLFNDDKKTKEKIMEELIEGVRI